MEVAAGLIKLNLDSITAPKGNVAAKLLLDLKV
jgi:hypothetical protein